MFKQIFDLIHDLRTYYEDFDLELNELLNRIAQIIGADFGYIGLIARARNRFLTSSIYIQHTVGIDHAAEQLRYKKDIENLDLNNPEASTTAWVISNNKSILTSDTEETIQEFFDKKGIGYAKVRDSKSCLCVPLTYTCKYPLGEQELVIGVIEFESDKIGRFSPENLEFVEHIAKLFGNRLWRNHRNEVINKIKLWIIDSKEKPIEGFVDIIFDFCRNTIFSDVGILTRYNTDVSANDFPPQFYNDIGLGSEADENKLEHGMLYYSLISHETELIKQVKENDSLYSKDQGRRGVTWEAAKSLDIQIWNKGDNKEKPFDVFTDVISTIAVPLVHNKELIGVITLEIQKKKDRKINYIYHQDSDDVMFLKRLAYWLAVAIKSDLKIVNKKRLLIRSEPTVFKEYMSYIEKKDYIRIGKLITKDEKLSKILEDAKKYPSDTIILITGETGTGKTELARAIHKSSGRTGNFEEQSLTDVPPNLIQTALFGTTKGAFTEAKDQPGWFELANGGTLFIDELGDVNHDKQSMLRKAIDKKSVRRIGEKKDTNVDVQLIFATNASRDRLRNDLLHRMKYDIKMPPLRERPQDILLLATWFFLEKEKKSPKNIRGLSERTLEALLKYPWDGNVREMETMIQKAIESTKNSMITPEDFPSEFRNETSMLDRASIDFNGQFSDNLGRLLTFVELNNNLKKDYLRFLISKKGGNVSMISRIADVQQNTINSWIKDLGLKTYLRAVREKKAS